MRLVYLMYYFWRLDWSTLRKFSDHVRSETGWSLFTQWRRIIRDSLRYNISILEFYQFRFYQIQDQEKTQWAGTGTMYEYQKAANPLQSRGILEDKRDFYKAYKQFFRHKLYTRTELSADHELCSRILAENRVLVLKGATGNCGADVRFESVSSMSPSELVGMMGRCQFDLVETLIVQHPLLQSLAPTAVNTVRIFTEISRTGKFTVLGTRLRISVNSPVDNLAAGNIAAPIDERTGIISGPGVYSDITKNSESHHPATGVAIVGFEIPYWTEIMAMIREASFLRPENRSIGWDVVVTQDGPGLLEGNHDWCKLVWQLPVQSGLKDRLDLLR